MAFSTKALLAASALGLLSPVWAQDNSTLVDYNKQTQPDLFPRTVATIPMSHPDCDNGPLKDNLVCNSTADHIQRAKAVVSLFSLEDLINNLQNSGAGVPHLGLAQYQVWNEALHGLDRANFSDEAGGEFSWGTSFPMPILSMAALNRTLINEIASIIALQARAFNNAGRYGLDSYAPNINPFRYPLWGRGQETAGEDPFVNAVYGYEYITGLQGGIDPEHLKVAATVKHFAAYDLENFGGQSRLGYDAKVSPQDLSEFYSPPFERAIRDARSWGLMCSYNSINGIPSCANPYLMQTLVRDLWNMVPFGYISSDCDAAYGIFNPHEFVPTQPAAAAAGLRAGTDVDCGQTYTISLNESVAQGLITREEIELSVTRLYAILVKAGYFDKDSPYRQLGWQDVVDSNARGVDYEAAVQGIVLLKNDGSVLPLSPDVKKIALIGPWANATDQMQGNYFGPAPFLITPLDAATAAGFEVEYVFGTNISSDSTAGFADALSAASRADAVIFLGGIDNTIEAEGMDRLDIKWPGNQLDLVRQLGGVGKPLIVCQFGGGQIDSSSIRDNKNISALVWAGYPGQSGGKALFDVLQGNQAPAGRLVTTQYPAAYTEQLAGSDMSVRPDGASNPGQTYQWYTGTAIYEFGFGLFYTTFSETLGTCGQLSFDIGEVLSAPHPDHEYIDLKPLLTFSVDVQNTGAVDSPYTAVLFVSTGDAGPTPRPNKWLVNFGRVAEIQAGQSATLELEVSLGSLARADESGNKVLYPGHYQLALNPEESVTLEFELTGEAVVLQEWPADDRTCTKAA